MTAAPHTTADIATADISRLTGLPHWETTPEDIPAAIGPVGPRSRADRRQWPQRRSGC